MGKIKKISRWAVPIALTVMPVLVFALIVPTVGTTSGDAITLDEIEDLIRGAARFLVIVSVIIAVIFIVLGGIMYMAARGNEEAAGKAKTTIFNGIIGAAVVLAVGVILNTLAAIITRNFFGGFTS